MLCSCIDVIKIALGTNDDRKICYTLMYLEEKVGGHLLQRAIRDEKSSGRSSEKVNGKAPGKGSDKKWRICHYRSS